MKAPSQLKAASRTSVFETAMALGCVVGLGCAANVERPEDAEQGGGGSAPFDACSAYGSKGDCCSNECLWLEPRDDFPGACLSQERECSSRVDPAPCGEDMKCFGRDLLSSHGECTPNYGGAGLSVGVCVEACPAEVRWPKEFCR